MSNIPTPHIGVTNKDDIAEVVIMPGDPLRAKAVAYKYLKDLKEINTVRNMLGYTGYYKGKKVSIMGSGMGIASIGVYSYELFNFYGVEKIIRAGSAGSYVKEINVYDVVIAEDAYSESTFAKAAYDYSEDVQVASKELVEDLEDAAKELGYKVFKGRCHSTDVFYRHQGNVLEDVAKKHNCQTVEMESFALFANARFAHKKAACILTVSDSFITHDVVSAEERQESFNKMVEIALEAAIK